MLPCCVCEGSSMALECFEIKTEADSSDISECSDDDKPSTSTGTFV